MLTLQRDDAELDGLQHRLHELDAGARALERERDDATAGVEKARTDVATEEKRHRELQSKFSEHKQLQEKNLAQLDAVKKAREATAAMSQIDITRRALMQDENDLQTADQRVRSLRDQLAARELVLEEVNDRIRQTREGTAQERARIEQEIATARAKREASAREVTPRLLTAYDRLRRRGRGSPLAQIRGASCAACNTAIPMQRRNQIMSGNAIEACEGCGVLLYASG
ncbi:MAG: zinc ribbon domain-containing protein [Gemmatimonadaceae bacterium]